MKLMKETFFHEFFSQWNKSTSSKKMKRCIIDWEKILSAIYKLATQESIFSIS